MALTPEYGSPEAPVGGAFRGTRQTPGFRDPIIIRAANPSSPAGPAWCYRVAGTDVLCDRRLPNLDPLAHGLGPWPSDTHAGLVPVGARADRGFRRQARGLIGRGLSDVELEGGGESLHLTIDGESRFSIRPDRILCEGSGWCPVTVEEAASGICLILALALRDCFVLHASAVHRKGMAIAFAGDSGSGKSTLAAYAGSPRAEDFGRLADDLLPVVGVGEGEVRARPGFPQLKLGGLDPLAKRQTEYQLQALIVLRPLGPGGALAIHRLEPALASITIAAHTAGARIFPPTLLRRHLEVAVALARAIPVYSLDYPHQRGAQHRVYDLIARLL